MTTTTQKPPVANPFRKYSKLHAIFHFMVDTKPHTLAVITDVVCGPGAGVRGENRRRTSSAIRSVRKIMEGRGMGVIDYSALTEEYRLTLWS